MSRFLVMTRIEFNLFFRNFFSVFFALAFPVSMLLLYGSMYGNEPSEFFGGHGTMDVSMPAYICMVLAVTGLMSLPLTIAQYRERNILKRFRASPVNPVDILLSQVLVNFIMSIAGMAVLIVIGIVVYQVHFFGNVFEFILAFILTTLAMFAIGMCIAGVSPNGKSATVLSYLIYFPMLFLSGATIPIELMPESLASFARILPLSYGVDLMKGVWLGDGIIRHWVSAAVLAGVFVVFGLISLKSFKWE